MVTSMPPTSAAGADVAPQVENLVGWKHVVERTGLSRATIQKLIDAGQFPQPFKLGFQFRWRASTLNDFLAGQEKLAG